jgi:hypothetical protein
MFLSRKPRCRGMFGGEIGEKRASRSVPISGELKVFLESEVFVLVDMRDAACLLSALRARGVHPSRRAEHQFLPRGGIEWKCTKQSAGG